MPSRRTTPYVREERVNDDVVSALRVSNRWYRVVQRAQPDDEQHPMVNLGMNPPLKMMDMTVLTEAELLAFRQFIIDACDRALPIVRSLDAIARAAHERGDTSYKRLWRPDPIRVDYDETDDRGARAEPAEPAIAPD